MNTTIDDFRNRVAAWSLDLPPASRAVEAIPGLIQARLLGGHTVVTVADPDQETTAAIARLSTTEPEQLAVTFEDAVIAYLSRSRNSQSFFTNTGA